MTAVLVLGFVPRLLREVSAPAVYAVAGGDHRVAAVLVAVVAALLLPAGAAVAHLGRRHRVAWVLLVPVVVVGLSVFALAPGRGDSGKVARALDAVVATPGAGEVLTTTAVFALLAVLVSSVLAVFAGLWFDRRSPIEVQRGRPGSDELLRAAGGEEGAAGRARERRRLAVQVTAYALVWTPVVVGCLLLAPS